MASDLAGEVGLQFGLELLLAGAEGVDLRFQGIAAVLQILEGQLHHGIGFCGGGLGAGGVGGFCAGVAAGFRRGLLRFRRLGGQVGVVGHCVSCRALHPSIPADQAAEKQVASQLRQGCTKLHGYRHEIVSKSCYCSLLLVLSSVSSFGTSSAPTRSSSCSRSSLGLNRIGRK